MWLFIPFLSGILLFYLSHYFPIAVSFILVLMTALLLRKKKALWMFVILAAFLYASFRQEPDIEAFICKDAAFTGVVTDFPEKVDFGYAQTVRVVNVDNCITDIRGREMRLFSPEPLEPATEGIFSADIKGTYRFLNPHNFRHDIVLSGALKKEHFSEVNRNFSWYIQSTRARLIAFFHSEFSQEVAGFLDAIIAGYKKHLPDNMRRAFQASGLSHLLAISGAHFGIFSFLIFSSFRFLLKRLPYSVLNRMSLYLSPSELAALLSIPFMIFYLFLSGAGIPAIRSFIMINVFLFGLLLGRKGAWKHSVAFAAFILLLISPEAIHDISFLLSFLAVLFIGYALEWWRGREDDIFFPEIRENAFEKLKKWVSITFIITVSAYIGTLPMVLYFFHSVSVISPLTNMVIAPVVCFVIIPLGVLGSFVYLIAGLFPLAGALQVISENVLLVIDKVAELKYIDVSAPAFPVALMILLYLSLFLLLAVRKRLYGIILSVLGICLIISYPLMSRINGFEVTLLDVGQAESSVLVLPDQKVMVIDVGKDGRQTVRYLDYLGINTIDALVLSHAGSDHAGGLDYVSEMKEVRMILDNGKIIYPPTLSPSPEQRGLTRGDIMEGEGYRIETLHPYEEFYTVHNSEASDENNNSLVLKVIAGDMSILFTGDIEAEAENDLLHLGNYLKSDILKVAHHGSRTSSSEAFIAQTDPSIAVISSGKFNPYGHPHEQTMRVLEGVYTLNTAEDGAIKMSVKPQVAPEKKAIGDLEVKTFREYRIKTARNLNDELGNLEKLFIRW